MPKVISHTPPWLCRPSPGASFFTGRSSGSLGPQVQHGEGNEESYEGPQRTLARRGNEIFTVVDDQIRWSSLTTLKDQWQAQVKSKKKSSGNSSGNQPGKREALEEQASYRVLTVPVYGRIKQLLVSPNGAYMAIVTAHTVHIAVLPDPSHLSAADITPIRLKTYQLGPTTHVIPESPVISALWHPLGIHTNIGGCIVTITADAAVRVWELDRNNHWSFDRPTLAIDLKKLVDGTSSDEDFTPLGFGKNKGFSADSFDMEVASACFGGATQEGGDAWAPMTLWIAMRPGDIYALCPLLPSRWQAPFATIPSLSAAIIPKLAAMEADPPDSEEVEDELIACRQQYEWLKEIDSQDHPANLPESDPLSDMENFNRPSNPSAIPRLQGPFQFDAGEQVDDLNVTDLIVIPAKLDTEALMTGEDDEGVLEENTQEGLSATVICISTTSGRVHICLELDGVEGQWLPRAISNTFRTSLSEPADLVLVESLDTVRENLRESSSWPTFTRDIYSRYSFFLTTANNVSFISLSAWAQRLETELQSEDTSGSAFRLNVLCDGSIALRELIIQLNENDPSLNEEPRHLSTSLVFSDYDLGYLLLTYRGSSAQAAVLDEPSHVKLPSVGESVRTEADSSLQYPQRFKPRRAPYQVPAIFYADVPLKSFGEENVPHRHRNMLREQVRLSPSTLDLIAAAHRVLAAHTGVLERAAADLFRRCERLHGEMREQLEDVAKVAERIKNVSSSIDEDGQRQEGSRSEEALNERLKRAKKRQEQLVQRYSSVRSKITKLGGRPLSDKEQAWVGEVGTLSDSIDEIESTDGERRQTLRRRLDTAQTLATDLLAEVKRIAAEQSSPTADAEVPAGGSPGSTQPRIPPKLQKAKVADAMKMVEREAAVIDAISSRLERLSASLT